MIPRSLSKLFPAVVRTRGDAYWASSRVQIDVADAYRIRAQVKGARYYAVEMDAEDGHVSLGCDCPHAAEHGACKHLWALLRVANHKELLDMLLRTAGEEPAYTFRVVVGGHLDARPMRPVSESQYLIGPAAPAWKQALARARSQLQLVEQDGDTLRPPAWPENKRIVYIVDIDASVHAHGIVVDLGLETLRKDGTWGEPRRFTLGPDAWFASPDASDRHIAQLLLGADAMHAPGHARTTGFVIPSRTFDLTLRPIIETGRCRTRSNTPALSGRTLSLDTGAPWQFRLRVRRDAPDTFALDGVLVRNGSEMPLTTPELINGNGFVLVNDTVATFDRRSDSPLISELLAVGSIPVRAELLQLLTELYALPRVPDLELPADSPIAQSHAAPELAATIVTREDTWRVTPGYEVRCEFVYGTVRIAANTPGTSSLDPVAQVIHHRHVEFEQAALAQLQEFGARPDTRDDTSGEIFVVPPQKLSSFTAAMVRAGWQVELEGVPVRAPGEIRASVSSGIDWFDLGGTVRYGDHDVSLAAVFDAQRKGLDAVPLPGGAVGIMPIEWLERLGPLAATGEAFEGRTRFRRSQLPLLDVLLATLPEVTVDETFARARAELASFSNIEPANPPRTFRGVLREYQRDGLGWMHFLRRFGLGGCLADDMGLGKTVQVLALLEARRKDKAGPSILVVPRSLVFNWIREAERFTPRLRVLDYSNSSRDHADFDDVDVVITTYGTLRRDAAHLVEREFDYAILDEAQAIKNAGTASAKACRLLRARYRLALTGTPVENRVEELWSLLEFLNPGMLGPSARFASLARLMPALDGISADDSTAGRALLAQALRPVILRRTKEKVAAELPERLEQTLEVELEPRQRTFYDSIRETQRARVMEQVDRAGLNRSQLHILEALLRLRQAACHPVLADKTKGALPSAKLDALIPALAEVTAEGHKALVFSQFTQFLALVRERLDEANICYEYLDGKTVDRQAHVDRFQNDPACPVFLISLRAGGHGLNLTSADYVYLLDPWWNPAVEAQAIDRAHRIGQTKRVIATRLVARDTIEEKILQLQAGKRALADAILDADQGALSGIGREELELLLG